MKLIIASFKNTTILYLILHRGRRVRAGKEQNLKETPLKYRTTNFDGDVRSHRVGTSYFIFV